MSLLLLDGLRDLKGTLEGRLTDLQLFRGIYQADSIAEGVQLAREKKISMFVVDLKLLGGSGHEFIDIIRQMPDYELTWIILLADAEESSQEIIDAFNANHCNRYIRKPYDTDYLISFIEDLSAKKLVTAEDDSRLRIRRKSRDYFFDHDEIVYLETVEKTAYIYTRDKKQKIGRITLGDLEKRLDSKKFLRVHRSYIINADYIDYIKKQNNQNQIKIKYYDHCIPVGRTYKNVLGLV